ncbi:hypothetical protein DL96DRAFT_1526278 [Flagelloscypha sp. PMI_526]|nr:hypothetical protein DL96DRAFT_1526278 [Flagelloscypha sp. PMI_526]
MENPLNSVLRLLSPAPAPAVPDEYDGFELRWNMFVFRPAYFMYEAVVVGIIFVYFVFHLAGRAINRRKAEKWADAHLGFYETQFSSPTASKGLVQDGNSDFFIFSTGRRNVEALHSILTLRPRHDIFQALFHTLRSWVDVHLRHSDDLQLDFRLQPTTVPNDFVFSLVHKDEMPWVKTDRFDLGLTRTTENQTLPTELVVMAEFADITESLSKLKEFQTVVNLLKDPTNRAYFKSLSITDQPRLRPEGIPKPEDKESHLILDLKLPGTSRSAVTLPLVTAVFNLIDALPKLALRPETKNKLKRAREDLLVQLKKDLEKDKEEVVEDKKAAKKRAEEERISKLSAAEQQKFMERERKRSQRKQQGKVAIRK